MTEDSKSQKITFHCSTEVADRLERMAAKADIARSKLVANFVETMLDYLEMTEKVGLFQLTIMIRDAEEKLAAVAKKWKEKKIS